MKKTPILLLFLFVWLCSNCSTNQKEKGTEETEIKNLVIPVTDTYLQTYIAPFLYPVIYNEGGKDYMVAYNEKIHTIDLFNLTDKKTERQIQLSNDGPNRIGTPFGLGYYKGLIVIKDQGHYSLLDTTGIIQKKCKYDELDTKAAGFQSFKPHQRLWFMYNFMPLDINNGMTGFSYYPPEINDSPVTHPLLIGILSLETGQTETIEIPHPTYFKQQNKWGALNDLNFCLNGDLVVYNFAGSSWIYAYNRKTQETAEYEIKSMHIDNLQFPEKDADENEVAIQAGYYFPLQYDPYRNVYWRLSIGPTRRRADYSNRIFTLTRISADFKEFKEIQLPDTKHFFTNLLIGKNGLWLNYIEGMAENDLWLFEIPLNKFDKP